MSVLGDAINQVRSQLDSAASQFMADTCSIILLTSSQDDSGGSGDTPSTVGSSIPCLVEALKVPLQKQVGGRMITGLDHQITLPANSTTAAILPKHKIVVAARGVTPEMTFNDPVVLPDSLGPFIVVAASLGVV